jgi:hypothetical protein
MTTFRDLELEKQADDDRFKEQKPVIPVVLCDEFGDEVDTNGNSMSALVDGDDNYVWYRAYNDAPPAQVLNKNTVPAVTGLPVFVGWKEDSVELEVLGINESALQPGQVIPTITEHATQHLQGGFDPLDLERRMFTMFKTTANGTALTINVSPFEYDDQDGGRQFYAGVVGYDLSGSQPASGYVLYVLVYVDMETNTLSTLDGTTVVDSPAVTITKPDVPINGIASAYVRLDGDQTLTVDSDIQEARRILSASNPGQDALLLAWMGL